MLKNKEEPCSKFTANEFKAKKEHVRPPRSPFKVWSSKAIVDAPPDTEKPAWWHDRSAGGLKRGDRVHVTCKRSLPNYYGADGVYPATYVGNSKRRGHYLVTFDAWPHKIVEVPPDPVSARFRRFCRPKESLEEFWKRVYDENPQRRQDVNPFKPGDKVEVQLENGKWYPATYKRDKA